MAPPVIERCGYDQSSDGPAWAYASRHGADPRKSQPRQRSSSRQKGAEHGYGAAIARPLPHTGRPAVATTEEGAVPASETRCGLRGSRSVVRCEMISLVRAQLRSASCRLRSSNSSASAPVARGAVLAAPSRSRRPWRMPARRHLRRVREARGRPRHHLRPEDRRQCRFNSVVDAARGEMAVGVEAPISAVRRTGHITSNSSLTILNPCGYCARPPSLIPPLPQPGGVHAGHE